MRLCFPLVYNAALTVSDMLRKCLQLMEQDGKERTRGHQYASQTVNGAGLSMHVFPGPGASVPLNLAENEAAR